MSPTSTPSDELAKALIAVALWGQGDWEHWSTERMEHFVGSLKHSHNYKEAKAAILSTYISRAEVARAIGEDEQTIITRPVMPGSIDPSPTETLDEVSTNNEQRSRNQLRAQLRSVLNLEEGI